YTAPAHNGSPEANSPNAAAASASTPAPRPGTRNINRNEEMPVTWWTIPATSGSPGRSGSTVGPAGTRARARTPAAPTSRARQMYFRASLPNGVATWRTWYTNAGTARHPTTASAVPTAAPRPRPRPEPRSPAPSDFRNP